MIVLTIRKAQLQDARFVYDLRFSPEVIEASLTSNKPAYDEHLNWFELKLNSPKHLFFVASMDNKLIGFLRYDLVGKSAEVSIAIQSEYRGKGLGNKLLNAGEEWLLKNTEIMTVVAKVKESNPSSIHMFSKSSFQKICVEMVKELKR